MWRDWIRMVEMWWQFRVVWVGVELNTKIPLIPSRMARSLASSDLSNVELGSPSGWKK